MKKPLLSDYVSKEDEEILKKFEIKQNEASNLSWLLIVPLGAMLYISPFYLATYLEKYLTQSPLSIGVSLSLVLLSIFGISFLITPLKDLLYDLFFIRDQELISKVNHINAEKSRFQLDIRAYLIFELNKLIDQTLPVLDEIKNKRAQLRFVPLAMI